MTNWQGWDELTEDIIPFHDFNKEKILKGILADKVENVGINKSTIYTLEQENGDKIKFWGSQVIDVRLKNAQLGEEIGIEYFGKKPSPNRKDKFYHDFKVYHKPAAKPETEEVEGF